MEANDQRIINNELTLEAQKSVKHNAWNSIYEFAELIVGAICLMLFLTSFIFRTADVDGDSMNPTLFHNEKLVVLINNNVFGKIKKGDIVVVNQPNLFNESIIKRVIGEEGDEVNIDFEKGEVWVNGILQEEDYVNTPTNRFEGVEFPVTVPKGCVFVLGDNRNYSSDSRYPGIGMIDKRYINAKAVFRYQPLKRLGRVK
ncbi:MAG: signal peptidase I [Oscillospiraceae bacterium]|nr:signal peptidase I [Oscillospiraceae bacterium]